MNLKYYTKYINSGIDWLGDIPKEWDLVRLKSIIKDNQNGFWGEEEIGDGNDIYCIRVADFDYENLSVNTNNLTVRNISNKDQQKAKLVKGDLLIEKSGGGEQQPVGRVVYFDKNINSIYSNFITKLRVDAKNDPNFIKYVFSWLYSIGVNTRSIKQTTGIQNLDLYSYLCEKVALPDKMIQTRIAEYLDRKISKINMLSGGLRFQNQKFQEFRQALISNVVTGKVKVI